MVLPPWVQLSLPPSRFTSPLAPLTSICTLPSAVTMSRMPPASTSLACSASVLPPAPRSNFSKPWIFRPKAVRSMCMALPSITRVSMPRPPSMRSKSPLLMRIVSSPAPPWTASRVPTLVKVSLPAPPLRRSAKPSLAMIVSSPWV
ncbi:hypothetical protein D9M69_638800 [compost metagenome]